MCGPPVSVLQKQRALVHAHGLYKLFLNLRIVVFSINALDAKHGQWTTQCIKEHMW